MAIHKENIKPTKRNLICNNAFRLFVEFMCMFMQKQNKFLGYNYNININIFVRVASIENFYLKLYQIALKRLSMS